MAPKRSRVSESTSQAAPTRFLSSVTKRQHGLTLEKGLVQEIGIEIPAFDALPRVREILTGYGWVPFNNMLGECNKSVMEELYANAFAFGPGDYRSNVRGIYVSFAPDHIDSTFGFRLEGQCGVQMRRASWREGAITDADYDQIREALAMPGKDWRYSRQGARQRIQATEMLPLAKLWARWWTHNFEACSNETEIITSKCLAIYSILMGEPIQVGQVIAQSIKRMVTSSDAAIGHPFVISHLCALAGVPEEDDDEIIEPEIPLGARFLSRAQRDLDRVLAAQQPQQPQQQQVHQPPPQHQFSEYELGMAATQYDIHVRMDWGLPRYSLHLMDAVQGYRAQHPLPSYRQQYPEQPNLTGHFNRQNQNLQQDQQQVQDRWDQAVAEELAAEIEEEIDSGDEGGH
ncbi:hypothetical protein QL285_021743 [Trifolium repens]|nr:hypothetical protein QL285_021743 [Trifolium repens]